MSLLGLFPVLSKGAETKIQDSDSSKIKIFPRSLYTSLKVSESLEQLFTESRKSNLTGNCMGFILMASLPCSATELCQGNNTQEERDLTFAVSLKAMWWAGCHF